MTVALALATVLAAGAQPTVTVRILESFHPHALHMGGHHVEAHGGTLQIDGAAAGSFALPSGVWRIEGRSFAHSYGGALDVTANQGELNVILRAPLESYVAGVVAAESAAGTPRSALEALAVVVRSYALAAHAGPLCDLAHCQIFHGDLGGQPGADARAAAEATAGEVLRLADGSIAAATFHASCGGHTADPREVFGGEERTGARPAGDLDRPLKWVVHVTGDSWRAAIRQAFHDPLVTTEPVLVRGAGGRVVQLVLPDGRVAAGDGFVRALDRAHGRGVVRSAAFEVHRQGDDVILRGSGHGHGVGLCQAGSALRAARGDGFEEILKAYFSAATFSH